MPGEAKGGSIKTASENDWIMFSVKESQSICCS